MKDVYGLACHHASLMSHPQALLALGEPCGHLCSKILWTLFTRNFFSLFSPMNSVGRIWFHIPMCQMV